MRIYAINGSPRKQGNTAQVLGAVLEGVTDVCPQAETMLAQLAPLSFTGCRSCFACKRLGGASYGRCVVRDGLSPLLERLVQADGIIFGSPVYFMNVSAGLRAVLERLLFPLLVYDTDYSSLAPRRMPTAFVYTMNIAREDMASWNLPAQLAPMEGFVKRIFSAPQSLYVCDTVQFDDYSRYMAQRFSEEHKRRHRAEQFPQDLRLARELGAGLARRAQSVG